MNTSRVLPSAQAVGNADERIARYSLRERVIHWVAAFTYVYDLVTGLAIWSPYMFWATALVGGAATARFWHPWLGLVFTVTVFCMYKLWRRDLATTDADRSWWKAKNLYIRNEDEDLPAIGRFNYGQKLFFWLMYYGIILLLLSGLVMWFNDSVPWNLRWLRYLAVAVHVVAAFATIGGFIIHVYMGTAMVRGSFTSIVSGEVSPAWAKTHHRLWYEEVIKRTATRP
jgi:formate dehydrogenase subunit gamma